eukprot:GEMP01072964.1.p1 GENE.GEMP01072964.1~~GEMP01072964.1.p1  ORF type:complete len:144 (+),score=34.87 GEMP01072964.1:72-503(+)
MGTCASPCACTRIADGRTQDNSLANTRICVDLMTCGPTAYKEVDPHDNEEDTNVMETTYFPSAIFEIADCGEDDFSARSHTSDRKREEQFLLYKQQVLLTGRELMFPLQPNPKYAAERSRKLVASSSDSTRTSSPRAQTSMAK